MSVESQYEREEEALYEQYERGDLTSKELQKELNELRRDYAGAVQEMAQRAYDDVIDGDR